MFSASKLLSTESINLIIQLLVLLFGGGLLLAFRKKFRKPDVRLLDKILKDEDEYLFAIKFQLKNIGKKNVNLDIAKIKIQNATPQKYNESIEALISFKYLLSGKRILKQYIVDTPLPISGKKGKLEYSKYPELTKNESSDILVTGLTTDTKGEYKLAIRLVCIQKILGISTFKTKWFEFDYKGEVPPAILIIGNNQTSIDKFRDQTLKYLNSRESGLIGFFSIRKIIRKKSVEDDVYTYYANRGADLIIHIKTEDNLLTTKEKLRVTIKSKLVNENMFLQFNSNGSIVNDTLYLDKFEHDYKEEILPKETFDNLKFLLHDIILYTALLNNKTATAIEQFNKLTSNTPNVMILATKAKYLSHVGRNDLSIKALIEAIQHIEEIEANPEKWLKHYKGFKVDNFSSMKFTLENNLAFEYFQVGQLKDSFYLYSKCLSKKYWDAPFKKFSYMWYLFTGITPTVTTAEAQLISRQFLSGENIYKIRDNFTRHRLSENNIYLQVKQVDIFDENTEFNIEKQEPKSSTDYLNEMIRLKEKALRERDQNYSR